MKQKNNQGFSLIEVLVAIVILAAFVVPTCSALVLSARMNAKTQALMQAQLDVSSAVETLMAEGIPVSVQQLALNGEANGYQYAKSQFPNVKIVVYAAEGIIEKEDKSGVKNKTSPWCDVTISSSDGLVEMSTTVRVVADKGVADAQTQ